MKRSFAFILFAVISIATAGQALADVKIKSRRSMSGQTSESTTFIKGKRSRSEDSIGGTNQVSITQCDLKRGIQLNPQTQMYIISNWDEAMTESSSTRVSGNTKTETRKGGVMTMTTTTKDTGETRKMFGYTARHYIVTFEAEASADACTPMKKMKMVTDGWYIDAEFALDCDFASRKGMQMPSASGGCRDRVDAKNIGPARRGYPVLEKMTMYDENGRETYTMTSEVTEISKATLEASLFEIPEGWTEAKDQQSMYTAAVKTSNSSQTPTLQTSVSRQNQTSDDIPVNVGPKKPGTVRIGLVSVKTGAVGEGMNAAELAGAVEASLSEYLKGTKIEIVSLEAKLAAAVGEEAREKECDFVLNLTVSHKKGGGGFGFGKALGMVVSQTGIGQTGNTVGNVAGQVATQSIVAATSSIKAKDELSLDVALVKDGVTSLGKQFKSKAKSAGEDIISPLVEQAATALVAAAK
jgi:hypothetical protein